MNFKHTYTAVICLLALLTVTGCAYFKNKDINQTAIVAKIAAKDATFLALQQHPEWKPAFEQAYVQIAALATQQQIDIGTLAGIIQRLPIKELKGTTAQIIISDVQIVVQAITPNNGTVVTSDNFADPKIVITAIRDGLRLGIDMTSTVNK